MARLKISFSIEGFILAWNFQSRTKILKIFNLWVLWERHTNFRQSSGVRPGPWDTHWDKQGSTPRFPSDFLMFTIENWQKSAVLPGALAGIPETPGRPVRFRSFMWFISYVPFLLTKLAHLMSEHVLLFCRLLSSPSKLAATHVYDCVQTKGVM